MISFHENGLRLNQAFATPIALYRILGSGALNAQLRKLILTDEQDHPNNSCSDTDGWRSAPDVFSRTEEATTILRMHIEQVVLNILKSIGAPEDSYAYPALMGWANVLRRGDRATPHSHPESVWSGVYYVDIGTPAEPDSQSGTLEFLDPRTQVGTMLTTGSVSGQPIRVQPEPSLLVLFPGWLYHFVHPYQGNETRISIAFNVLMTESLDNGN
jgi:uncharacterized protein (TIGR02466 family)